jgi:hypothetical protein
VAVKGDISDFDSLPSVAEEIAKVGGGKIDVLIKYVSSPLPSQVEYNIY